MTTRTSETGMVRNVMPASWSDTETIMTVTPMSCVSDVTTCVTHWLSDCPTVVDVVGDARQHVADAVGLEVPERHAVDLLDDLAAHAVAHALGEPRHEEALQKVEEGGRDVQAHEPREDVGDALEVDGPRAGELGGEALEELGGRHAENARPHHVEDDRGDGASQGHEERQALMGDIGDETADGAGEILGALGSGPPARAGHQRSPPFWSRAGVAGVSA